MTPTTFMRPTLLCATLATAVLLGACAPILVGGAVMGGTMMVDRRSSGTQVDDQGIELKSVTQIDNAIGDRGHINITSYNRQVLITGEVPTEADKVKVEQAVAHIPNVRSVVNELTVGPSSSIGTRSNDTLLTSKVKASIVDAKDLQTSAYKVVTENGVVYLMGRVTQREATRASDVARGVSGVRKVVLVFEIVTEAELADLQAAPAPAAASAAKP